MSRDFLDAIIHVSDFDALLAAAGGALSGMAVTPAKHADTGPAALVYIRPTVAQAAIWRGTPGVTILAEAPFNGSSSETSDQVYATLAADADALALYDAVYDRTPVQFPNPEDEGGGITTYTPPFRFGQLA